MRPTFRTAFRRTELGASVARVLLLGALGCGIFEPSPPIELPDEDRSTDPAALRLGEFVYPCGHWFEFTRPAADHLLVDIFFFFGDARHPGLDRPALAHRQIVERYGGVILRSYNLSGMRVWFPTDSIPQLDQDHPEAVVHFVPDPRRYDTTIHIAFNAGVDIGPHTERIEQLGGRLLLMFDDPVFGYAFVLIPNRAIPSIRGATGIKRLFYSGLPLCF
jgi:hypothetical protein